MTYKTYNTIEESIKAKGFILVSEKNYCHKGKNRTIINVKKPKGRKVYYIVKYEDGTYSEGV